MFDKGLEHLVDTKFDSSFQQVPPSGWSQPRPQGTEPFIFDDLFGSFDERFGLKRRIDLFSSLVREVEKEE